MPESEEHKQPQNRKKGKLTVTQIFLKDFSAFPNINARTYVMSIMNIPTTPNRAATPAVLAPKTLPSTIKKIAVVHTKTPNAINTYRQPRTVISPLQLGLKQPNLKPCSILMVFQSTN
jgi:hypothetical protein